MVGCNAAYWATQILAGEAHFVVVRPQGINPAVNNIQQMPQNNLQNRESDATNLTAGSANINFGGNTGTGNGNGGDIGTGF